MIGLRHAVGVLLGVSMLMMASFATAQSQQSHLRHAIRKGVLSPHLLSTGKVENDRQSLVSKFGEETFTTIDVSAGSSQAHSPRRQLATQSTTTTLWTQFVADIDGDAANDYSGRSVAISSNGKIVAIGASGNDGENGGAEDSGHVRVFDISGATPRQIGNDIYGEAAGDFSGGAVAISSDGSRVAIGAFGNSNDITGQAGHVRVFDFVSITDTWTKVGNDIDGEAAGDFSGYALAISADGSRVAIGADGNTNDNTGQSGHVRVFDFDLSSDTWTKVGQDIDGRAANDLFGISVALSSDGDRVVIGAIGTPNQFGSGGIPGYVRVFDAVSSSTGGSDEISWDQIGGDIDGDVEGDQFGYSVAISWDGTRIVIGAVGHDLDGRDQSGVVRAFDLIGGAWTKVGQDIGGETEGDFVGYSVAISKDGNRVAIGAVGSLGTTNAGSNYVRVFDLVSKDESSDTWNQIGEEIPGEKAGDDSGVSVTISSDGSRVAIGAPFNDGNEDAPTPDSGHVRIYDAVVRSPFFICLYAEPPSEHALFSRLTSPSSFCRHPITTTIQAPMAIRISRRGTGDILTSTVCVISCFFIAKSSSRVWIWMCTFVLISDKTCRTFPMPHSELVQMFLKSRVTESTHSTA
jgi:hypothetical protein